MWLKVESEEQCIIKLNSSLSKFNNLLLKK